MSIFLATLSTVFVPVPEEATLLGAGYYVRLGSASLAGCVAAAWVAVVLGDVFAYFVGRELLGRALRTRWGTRAFPEDRRVWGERLVSTHAIRAIVVARFLVGLRGFVYMALGSSRYPFGRFLVINAAVAIVEVGILVAVGFGFGVLHARADESVGTAIDLAAAGVLAIALFAPLAVRRLVSGGASGATGASGARKSA